MLNFNKRSKRYWLILEITVNPKYFKLITLFCILINFAIAYGTDVSNSDEIDYTLPTRRILHGNKVGDTKPYMVYLRPASYASREFLDSHWLCGGVIIDKRYVLTSAACIEDAKHFYVISGTHKYVPPEDNTNECIINGAKRAVSKCVPKSYFFDGDAYDNIRWMVGDIAIVKVEDDFNFERRVRGCDFIPKQINFNNISKEFEKSATVASIAGWGSVESFVNEYQSTKQPDTRRFSSDMFPIRSAENNVELLETNVIIIANNVCKKQWDERYHFIIDDSMICTKDVTDGDRMSKVCEENQLNCKMLMYSEEDYTDKKPQSRRMIIEPSELVVHTAAHHNPTRRQRISSGGFCENDHGGPLIVGQGKSAKVIGIMSACLTKAVTNKCYGPFLYTSVYKYRNLLSCVIDKDMGSTCRNLLRSSRTPMEETFFDWPSHPQRPQFRRPKTDINIERDLKRQQIAVNEETSIEERARDMFKDTSPANIVPDVDRSDEIVTQGPVSNQKAETETSSQKDILAENLVTTLKLLTTEDPLSNIKNVLLRRFFN